MKSPLRKLQGFPLSLHRQDRRRGGNNQPPAKQDELVQASQDMNDMRDCYDSLLSAAASAANSAYEFAEALKEMGTCLLEKTALNDDEDSGRVLLMLGKAQFELQKLVDSYRTHIIQTIMTPSESLLKELQTVEEKKNQCDDKRDLYKFMLAAKIEKRRSKNVKGKTFSSQQLQAAQEDYEEEATLFVFRLKSLKRAQSRSLLTQAARHHASQLNFFRKAFKTLEVVEPHVKVVAEQEHIDYQFSELEDDETDDDDYYGYDDNDDGELSFDYGPHDQGQDIISRNSNEGFVDRTESDFVTSSMRPSIGSKSVPIFPDMKFDPSEKIKELHSSSTRKFQTYVLPTPSDVKSSVSAGFGYSISNSHVESKDVFSTNLWHSSPLEPYKSAKVSRVDEQSSPTRPMKSQSIIKERSIKSGPINMPPPLGEGLSQSQFNIYSTENRNFKRPAFSGPIIGKTWSSKPLYTPSEDYSSPEEAPRFYHSISTRVSTNAYPPPAKSSDFSSPKINELHELPRPPINSERRTRPSSLIGHSAPLVSRGEHHTRSNMQMIASHAASPLPTPPAAMARSYSIPASIQRTPTSTVTQLLEAPQNREMIEDVVDSPPLTPIPLKNHHPVSRVSESLSHI